MKIFGRGFNFSQDGPGNRLVFHLSGCNMKCPWCSNPEGMDGIDGEDVDISELFLQCERSKAMFFGGGGVTFTGGECTLQHSDLFSFLSMLKKAGIHTAIETNGTSGRLSELLPYVDYLMMDFKHFDDKILEEATGVGGHNLKKNFQNICESGRQLHIRIPIIGGFNDTDPKGFAEYFSGFSTENVVFEFLPYHEYGKEKWKSEYKIKNGFISDECLLSFKKTFEEYGLKIVKT